MLVQCLTLFYSHTIEKPGFFQTRDFSKTCDTRPETRDPRPATITETPFSLVKNLFNTPISPPALFSFACSCSSKFWHILLPKTCRLFTFVFFEESRLSCTLRVRIYNCEKLLGFAKQRPMWIKNSTCRTAHTWKNMIRGSWLDVSLFSHVRKAIRDIWLVYIGLRTKIYFAAL